MYAEQRRARDAGLYALHGGTIWSNCIIMICARRANKDFECIPASEDESVVSEMMPESRQSRTSRSRDLVRGSRERDITVNARDHSECRATTENDEPSGRVRNVSPAGTMHMLRHDWQQAET